MHAGPAGSARTPSRPPEANLRENRQELDETPAEIHAKGQVIEHAAKWLATAHAFKADADARELERGTPAP
jgi:hypothetical protein